MTSFNKTINVYASIFLLYPKHLLNTNTKKTKYSGKGNHRFSAEPSKWSHLNSSNTKLFIYKSRTKFFIPTAWN